MSSSSPLEQPVFADGAYKPFGEFTAADVRARADELRAVTGWGPTARVGGVARAWASLARRMDEAGAARVGDLAREEAEGYAGKLWVVPPGGSLL
jgi:hypothetical protein